MTSERRSTRRPALLSGALGWAAFAMLVAAAIYLFYFGGYRNLLVDESASFATELTMRILDANRDARLLVIGNSTVAEGFRASTYNRATAPRTALNLGIGSAHFYVYDKLFELALQRGLTPEAVLVVLTPETLSFRPGYDLLLNDLTLMKTELAADDYARVWQHTGSLGEYVGHAGYLALRPALYSSDMRDLVTHPLARARKLFVTYNWLKTAGKDPEGLETDNQFAVCEAGPLRELEQRITAGQSDPQGKHLADLQRVWDGYSVRVHQPLRVEEAQKQRLALLLRKMTGRVAHVYVALAPYYDPDFDAYPAEYRTEFVAAVKQVAGQIGGVTLLQEFPADCTMFFDTVHLNHTGGDAFTLFLKEKIAGESARQ